ncbi:MAG TPA: hypothetical protein VFF16_13655 [Telluria sp.]|nr:hypothetical protein [Telluria sp.]
MKERDAAKLYMKELFAGLGLYMLLLVAALRLAERMPDGVLRTALLLSPMLGFALALWAIVRQFARMDEYIRRFQLENMAIAAAVTAGWTFTYGFLESAGFPRLSMFSVWPVMGAVWGGLCFIRPWIGK